MGGTSDVPVLSGVAGPDRARRSRNWRRVGIVILVIVVVLACLGWLGPRDTTVSDTAGEVSMDVTHPQLTRSGMDSAIEFSVKRRATDGPVTVELPSEVFDRFGLETIVPAPSDETTGADSVVLTFENLPTSDVTIMIVGRMPTRSTIGSLSYPVRVDAGGESLQVTARTWVLP